jgi:hypothetical protein
MKGLLLGLVVATFLFVGSASNVNAQCGDSCSCAPVRGAVKSVLKNTACAWDKIRPVRRIAAACNKARPVRRVAAAWDKARPVRRFASAWNQRRPVRSFFGRCSCQ